MAGTSAGRIDVAAVFTGPVVTLTLFTFDRGPESLLRIATQVDEPYGSPQAVWARGGWADGRYVPPTWNGPGDPWQACSYWGPVRGHTGPAAKFCGNCGTPRVPGGRFCGGCGAAFADDPSSPFDARAAIAAVRERPGEAPALLLQLLQTHAWADLADRDRQQLSNQLQTLLAGTTLERFIDGRHGAAGDDLTLAAAQTAGASVTDGGSLFGADAEAARLLLTRAPLEFGYWGPFKAILKNLDPHLMPEEFGVGVGRLSAAEAPPLIRDSAPTAGCEDITAVSAAFRIPSARTLGYMTRRMRRQLQALADSDPDTYVVVAAAALAELDAPMTSSSFVAGYILLGQQQYLTGDSRRVSLPVDQSVPRYPQPQYWQAHADLALGLVQRVRRSPEIFTFAVQVLTAAGRELPALDERTVPLAVASTDPQVARLGHAGLASSPDCWASLSENLWTSVMLTASEEHLAEIADALLHHPRVYWAAVSAWRAMTGNADLTATRLASIARVYLAYSAATDGGYRPWAVSAAADQVAVTVLARVVGFDRTPDVWRPVLAGLDRDSVLAALIDLVDDASVTPATIAVLEDVVAMAADDRILTGLAQSCFSVPTGRLDELAQRLIRGTDNPQSAVGGLWEWARTADLPAARQLAVVQRLLAVADQALAPQLIGRLLTDEGWNLDSTQLAVLLAASTDSAALLWQALGSPDPATVLGLITDHDVLLTAVGDHLTVADLTALTDAQQAVLAAYLAHDPTRITRDRHFGVKLACLPSVELQRAALAQLTQSGALPEVWLALAESGLPLPLTAAGDYLEHLTDRQAATDAVLAAIDSQVAAVRDLGLALLDSRRDHLDDTAIWQALLESDDRVVQARVAEEALVRNWEISDDLGAFDRRVLVTRRVNRRAKEQVKQRLATEAHPRTLIQPARMDALLDLAGAANRRDREWALQRLAALSLSGVQVDGVTVSTTSGGGR